MDDGRIIYPELNHIRLLFTIEWNCPFWQKFGSNWYGFFLFSLFCLSSWCHTFVSLRSYKMCRASCIFLYDVLHARALIASMGWTWWSIEMLVMLMMPIIRRSFMITDETNDNRNTENFPFCVKLLIFIWINLLILFTTCLAFSRIFAAMLFYVKLFHMSRVCKIMS